MSPPPRGRMICAPTQPKRFPREQNTHYTRRVCAIEVKSGCRLAGRQPKAATWCRYRCAGCKEHLAPTSRFLWGPGCRQYVTRALAPSHICWQTPVAFCLLCRHGQSRSPRRAKRFRRAGSSRPTFVGGHAGPPLRNDREMGVGGGVLDAPTKPPILPTRNFRAPS